MLVLMHITEHFNSNYILITISHFECTTEKLNDCYNDLFKQASIKCSTTNTMIIYDYLQCINNIKLNQEFGMKWAWS